MSVPAIMSVRFQEHRNSRLRLGFTLLETLLALSLLTVLMTTIATSTSLYARYRYRSLEGARLAKALQGTMDELQSDFRACFDLQAAHVSDQVGGENRLSRGTNTIESNMLDSSVAREQFLNLAPLQPHPIRFVGRSNAILLLRQGANPRFEWTEFNPLTSECQILWLAPNTRSIRLPCAVEQLRTVEQEYQIPDGLDPMVSGLHRCWTPLLDSRAPREAWSYAKHSISQSWDKNSEVQRIQFRFFDGVNWRSEWNSHLQDHRLPVAVEVELTLGSTSSNPMRYVVRLPR